MSVLKDATRKALVNQTSEQLFKKLNDGKLLGASKDTAVEILTERKAKGKFDGDLTAFATSSTSEKPAAKVSGTVKDKSVKKEKKEKVVKEPRVSKRSQEFPDFKLKFKKGQEVRFTPFRETKELKGNVLSSYAYKPKGADAPREDVRIKAGTKVYVKKGSEVKVV